MSASSLYERRSLLLKTLDGLHEIPFTVIAGSCRTPVALIMAGVHGDEYEGPAATQDLIEEIDPALVRGSIVFVPVANPAAFAAATRRHPADGGDLNRSFPGNREGTPTQQLAHLLFKEFALKAAFILSLHGWSKEWVVTPYAEYPDDGSEPARISREAALALGFRFLHPYKWPKGVLGEATKPHGIPIVEAEIGGAGIITREGQALYKDVILRFLAHFEILAYRAPSARRPVIINHSNLLSSCAGLFRSCAAPGEAVSEDQQIGTVRGADGSVLQTLRAPRHGFIGVLRTLASVQPDDLLIQLFWEDSLHESD